MSRKRRGYENKKGVPTPKFIMLRFDFVDSAAWQELDPVARVLYLELKRRFNGSNNGSIGLGCREAAAALHVGVNTVSLAFKRLRQHDLVEPMAPALLTTQGRRATEWLLTECPDDVNGTPASNAFKRWSKNISPVLPQRRRVLPQRRNATSVAPKTGLRPTTDTQQAVSTEKASYQDDTYTSSHRPPRAGGRQRGANQTASALSPLTKPSEALLKTVIVASIQKMTAGDA